MGIFLEGFAGGGKKEGRYVWEKYEVAIPYTAYSVSNDGSVWVFTIDSTEIDLTQYDDLSVLGKMEFEHSTSSNKVAVKSEDGLTFAYYLADAYQNDLTAVWDKTTKTLTLTGGCPSNATLWSGMFYDITLHHGAYIGHVVNDDETAYPDGAEQDGYWYERVSEGLTPEMFGCTKMAVDTFSFSSRGQMGTKVISHSLNDVPKMAIIIPKTKPTTNYNMFAFFGTNPYGVSGNKSNGSFASYENSGSFGTVQGNFRSEISQVGTSIMNAYYEAGVEYTLFTFA